MRRLRHARGILTATAVATVGCVEAIGPVDSLPRALSVAEQNLVQANNTLALDLLRDLEVRENGTNVFVSPLSIAMALGMTYNGAAGSTRDQMEAVLGLEHLTLAQTNQAYRDLIDLLLGLDERVEFVLANSIWYRNTMTFDPAFLDRNTRFFDAQVTALDFADPGAPGTIDAWVTERTRGRITQIAPRSLDDLVMFLINAVYFKANWTTRFDESLTVNGVFRLEDGGSVNVPLMTHGTEIPVRMATTSTARVLELPYGGDAFAMTIVLPADPDASVSELVAGVDDTQWSAWVDALDSTDIQVVLPKFTLEYEITLNDALKALGMTDAFDPDLADFTGMHQSGDLFVDHVKHKTFLQVDERGTEATAVTSVGIGVTSAPAMFRVDRPFVLAIRERFSGTILFMGRILNPAQ